MLQGLTRSYTIAFAPRSGSTEICGLLRRNGFGAPAELFQYPPPRAAGSLDITGFQTILEKHQANGIFGSKMAHNHRAGMDEYLRVAVAGYGQLDDILPNHRWVWLTRRDRLQQVVSMCRAEQSDVWAVGAGGSISRAEFKYDFFQLLSRLCMLQAADLIWELYFTKRAITPLRLIYEDFFSDVPGQLRQLIDFLGGPAKAEGSIDIESSLSIQRTDVDQSVRERFSRDLDRIGEAEFQREWARPMARWNKFFFEYGWRDTNPE